MSRIFISHSSRDNFEAVAIRDWLAAEGWDEVFLDLDPDRGIAGGERWERALHAAANRCEAVVFLVSAAWLDSGWCRKEYMLARGLNKTLLAVLIDGELPRAALPADLKGTWQVVDLTSGQDLKQFRARLPGSHEEKHAVFSQAGLRRLKRGLEKAGLDPRFFAWPPANEPDRPPYRGLKPLDAADAGIFFGRDAPIVEAADKLRGLAGGAGPRLLVMLGASGAGKSSFLRAGLLPRLARDDRHFLPLPVIRPERAALTGDTGLLGALVAACPDQDRAALRAALQAGSTAVRPILAGLVAAAVARQVPGDDRPRPPAVVVAVDQAEELFRAEGADEGTALLALLRDLTAADDPALIVLFAIRTDSYDALERAKPLDGVPQATLPLLPMPRGAYGEVIEGPARRVEDAGGKLALDPALVQRLLTDIEAGGSDDALPLLAFTLEQLYLDHRRAGVLRLADYTRSGGLRGAIEGAVERALARADADPRLPRDRKARESLLRRGLVPWLAGIDPDTRSPRRNIARRADIPAEAAPLIDLLVEERLLSTDTTTIRDAATGLDRRLATVEPTHEALLRQWGLLQKWLAEDLGILTVLEGIKRAGREWSGKGSDDAWLAHGGLRLAEALALDARPDIAARLDETDRRYLAACGAREEAARAEAEQRRREREEERERRLADAESLATANRRTTHRTRLGLAAAILLAVAAGGFGVYARKQQGAAEQAQRATEAEKAHADAMTQVATAQKEKADAKTREATANLSASLAALSAVKLPESAVQATKLALAAWPRRPDGDDRPRLGATMAALSKAVVSLRLRRVLPATMAALSPDGLHVVTPSGDVGLEVRSVDTGEVVATLTGHQQPVSSVTYAADGARIVTVSPGDRTVRVWEAGTGRSVAVLPIPESATAAAALSPDGRRLVVATGEESRVWDVASGQPIATFAGADHALFSPDGSRVVATSTNEPARIWDAENGRTILVLRHDDWVVSAAFSADGSKILTVAADGVACVWDAATGRSIATLRGVIGAAVLSPDGTRVATAAGGSNGLWDAASGKPVARLDAEADDVAFSPDGLRVFTLGGDGIVRLWDGMTGRPLGTLREGVLGGALVGHNLFAGGSRGGARLAVAPGDATVDVWDVGTGQPTAVLRATQSPLSAAAFSPDGTRVVTASDDQTASVWDVPTGRRTGTLSGHGGPVRSASFSRDGSRILTASDDNTARIWDSVTLQPIATLSNQDGGVGSAAFSPDGARIVTTASDKVARLWSVATGEVVKALRGHRDRVVSAAFSPDGTRIVTASADRTARVWDAMTGRPLRELHGHRQIVHTAEFSPDGTRVVTASADHTARVWDADSGAPLMVLHGAFRSAAFSPDGSRIVTALTDNSARVWDIATGQTLLVLDGHDDQVTTATFSPDGTRVLTASLDTTARIWSLAGLPKGNLFQIACAWLPDLDLTDIARAYGITDLEPICRGDPPLPEPERDAPGAHPSESPAPRP